MVLVGRDRWLTAAHLLAGTTVVAGLVAEIARPLAPDVGAPLPAGAWFDDAYLARAAAFRSPLYVAGLARVAVRVGVACAAAFTPAGRRLTGRIVAAVGEHRPARAAAAVVTAVVVATDVVLVPLEFWATFVHEGAFGLRTQGLAGWAYDWLATRAPSWLAVAVVVAGAVALARRLPRAWPPVAGLAGAVLGIAVTFAAPLVLEPLQFSTRPLPDGPVRAAVERVVARAGGGIDALLVADASRRTTRQNAYVSGLGTTRRVVLYDTLVAQRPPAEVAAVVAHELGHDRHADLWRQGLFAGAGAVVVAYTVAAVTRARTRRGRQRNVTDPRAAPVVLAIVVALTLAALPLQNWVSRRAEAAADLAALDLTAAPDVYARLQEGLTRANLSEPAPPGWATALWATHPAAVARLTMTRRWPL